MQIYGSKNITSSLTDPDLTKSIGLNDLVRTNDAIKRDCHRERLSLVHCNAAFQRMRILKAKNKPTVYRALFKFTLSNFRKIKLG